MLAKKWGILASLVPGPHRREGKVQHAPSWHRGELLSSAHPPSPHTSQEQVHLLHCQPLLHEHFFPTPTILIPVLGVLDKRTRSRQRVQGSVETISLAQIKNLGQMRPDCEPKPHTPQSATGRGVEAA